MAGASVQGLIGFSALQTKPRFSGAFLWALNQGKAERGLGREPRPWAVPPRRGLFRRGPGPRSFKVRWKKGGWGLGFHRARCWAGNVLRFKFSGDLRPLWWF